MTGLRPLALDQSLTGCGWALLDHAGAAHSGTWHLADGITDRAAGFVELHRQLSALHQVHGFNLLAYEAPVKTRVDKVDKLVALYGLVAHVESWARVRGVAIWQRGGVDQRTWRTSWLGQGYARGNDRERVKRMAVERARQYGFDPTTTDEAEALGILDHVMLSHKLQPAWRVAQPFLAMI